MASGEQTGSLHGGGWSVASTAHWRVDLGGGPHAPAAARRAVEEHLGGHVERDALHSLDLLVTELVTNAVRHGGAGEADRISLHLAVAPDRVRVEVCDPGPGFVPGEPEPYGEGGYGLFLVEQLGTRWGVSNDPVSCVWFEIERTPLGRVETHGPSTDTGTTPPASVISAPDALAFLAEASAVLAGSFEYERTLAEVAQLAVPEIADWCAVDVLEPDGSTRQITSGHPDPEQEELLLELRRRYRSEKEGSEGVLRVIRTGEAELAEDVSGYVAVDLSDEEAELYRRLAPRSYMIVPLVARGRTIGALTLLSTLEGRHYTRADLDFAQHLSRRFALALDNARLYDEAERARSLVDTLFDSAPVGLGFYDTELRCVRVNEALAEMNGRAAEDHVGGLLSELLGDAGERLGTTCRRVLETGQPVVGLDVAAEMPPGSGERRHYTVSFTPMAGPDEAALGVAAAVMDVTERRTLLDRERAGARRARFMARAAETLESSLDFDTTLQNVANVCVPDVADICWVRVVGEDGEIRLGAFAHEDPAHDAVAIELDRRFPVDPDSGVGAMAAIRSGRTDVVPQIDPDVVRAAIGDSEQADLFASLGATASISVPLRARGRTMGAITVMTSQSHRSFSPDDVRLMEELARRAGLSIDNARLYTERTRIAHTLQAELLPSSLPQIPGAEVAVRYRAAGELNEVGGDFYDVFQRPDGDTALVIGDVSGKGAEAAAVTALARHTLRASSMHGSSPTQALLMLNEALVVQRGGAEFCTVCAARLHVGGTLELSLAGHPPALVLRRDGSVERHGESGTLLGVFPDPNLTQTSVALESGDTLLLYTDGVTDTGPGGAELGEAALEKLLGELAGRSPEEIVAEVEAVAVATQEDMPRDDIALVAVRIA